MAEPELSEEELYFRELLANMIESGYDPVQAQAIVDNMRQQAEQESK